MLPYIESFGTAEKQCMCRRKAAAAGVRWQESNACTEGKQLQQECRDGKKAMHVQKESSRSRSAGWQKYNVCVEGMQSQQKDGIEERW